jgi:pimeloyl-ACP methyl ester carboxylesterase
VQGRQGGYFDFFFDALPADPSTITTEARAEYVRAYSSDASLTAGFNWYRAFTADAAHAMEPVAVKTPVLYLRGERGSARMASYVDGFRAAGLANLTHDVVPGAGHFAHEEAPEETWRRIADFVGR